MGTFCAAPVPLVAAGLRYDPSATHPQSTHRVLIEYAHVARALRSSRIVSKHVVLCEDVVAHVAHRVRHCEVGTRSRA